MRVSFQKCGIIAAVSASFFLSTKSVACQTPASKSSDSGCAPLIRKHNTFHRLIWSGIFPFEGGFIPDPHCLSSEPMAFTESASKLLNAPGATYQIFDVNPFFNDKSSEVVLLVLSGKDAFEYSLVTPKHRDVRAVLGTPTPPPVRAFPYRGKLALLANFFGPAKGIYLLSPPLRTRVTLQLIPVTSPLFEEIAHDLKSQSLEQSGVDQFCRTTNDFAAFFEKYVGPCETPHLRGYDDFWSLKRD
jgi:hypothetical protein